MTNIDELDCGYGRNSAVGRRDYQSGLGLSVFLHVTFAVALSCVAVVPQSLYPNFITTMSIQDESGDDEIISLVSPISEIPTIERVEVPVVLPEASADAEVPGAADPQASLPDHKAPARYSVADVEPPPQNAGAAIAHGARFLERQQLSKIRSRVSAAGGSSGLVQFSLVWEGKNDLDLHVVAPSGERVFFYNRRSSCHAELDLDMNARPECDAPVENIHWPESRAPDGRYTVLVNYYCRHVSTGPVPYRLMIKRADYSQVIEGVATNDNDYNVHRTLYLSPQLEGADRTDRLQSLIRLQRRENAIARQRLNDAMRDGGQNTALASVVLKYPHTNAAVDAIRLLSRRRTQRSQLSDLIQPTGPRTRGRGPVFSIADSGPFVFDQQ